MSRVSDNKIILIKRKTRLEDLIVRYNTIDQVKFYIEHLGSDFSDYILENEKYKSKLKEAYDTLEKLGRVQIVDREYISNFIFGDNDIVVVLGQDGLVANSLKYLENQMVIGVNPDLFRWDGVLLPFEVSDLNLVVQDVLKKKMKIKEVSMAKAILNDGQSICAVNDIFIGQKTHVSSRYNIKLGTRQEDQSSSGIIISTGLGSTGWLKSIISGATNIVNEISNIKVNSQIDKAQNKNGVENIKWNSNYLYFTVREPFPSKTSKTDIVFGKITDKTPLKILSYMPENGVIFSDGIESDYLQFNSGIEAKIALAEKKGHLVV